MSRTLSKAVFCLFVISASSMHPARACSVFYEPKPYEETLAQLREPRLLNHVRDAAAIYVARVAAHRRSGKAEPPDLFDAQTLFATEYRFSVTKVLKGADVDSFWYRPKLPNDYLAVPLYDADGREIIDAKNPVVLDPDASAQLRHSYFSFWVDDESLGIGESTTAGDCRTYVFFESGVDYLFVLDNDGKALSAERIVSGDDAWLAAVRHVVENPDATDLGALTVEALFSTLWGSVDRMTVARCGRSPKVVQTNLVTGELENYVPRKAFWFDDGEDPYIEFPFDRSACRKGSSYLRFQYYQWLPIGGDDVVDFRSLAFAKRIVGETRVRVSQIANWAKEAPHP